MFGKLTGTLSAIGGLSGSLSGDSQLTGFLSNASESYPAYEGPYICTPRFEEETVLETNGKYMQDNVTVLNVPHYEVRNASGGTTVYIAMEV